ncbi:hypothetical protein [Pseudolysinimonas kribbensis]|uniref:hypothetical protein n=1 Tax=Pseudolysinimonas kribbensis TaxID=433641 RepID=UPI0024E07976|nr:hypothetical protein [Pseudolysinimonas kribbensis]
MAGAIQVAVVFGWLGMVLAISFLEAPLKFRAPGITTELGVGIGRLVFRVLNLVEAVLALAVLVTSVVPWPPAAWPRLVLAVAAAVILVVQAGVLRRRMDARVLGGRISDGRPRHRLHLGYIALEGAKVIVLLALGVIALGAPATPA